MNNTEYVRLSLELHLFFDRIMKEHSFFLEAAFMEKDANFKKVAREFQKLFANNLNKAITLANGNVSSSLLAANEIVTKNTIVAEEKTNELADANLDTDITRKELALRSGGGDVSNDLVNSISILNKQTLPLIGKLINFKTEVLNNVVACKMYTTNYPLLITHITNEAKMYYMLLNKVEHRSIFTKNDLYEQELFWNNIMKEHAEFIRGLLDPSEEALITTADKFAKEYKEILNINDESISNLTTTSLNETINFRDFKIAGEEGILNCKMKSIIIPLLADHVVREANHFIRILESINV